MKNRSKYGNRFKRVFFSGSESISTTMGIVEIGEYTGLGGVGITNWTPKGVVKIGRFCLLANGVKIFGDGNHNMSRVTTYHLDYLFVYDSDVYSEWYLRDIEYRGPTIIGNDVWIGADAMILPGVNIGDGAVIGACAVVAKDVPPYAIVAGNPAKIVRWRFSEEQIKELLKIRWWGWDVKKIKENIDLFDDVDKFIKTFKVDKNKS